MEGYHKDIQGWPCPGCKQKFGKGYKERMEEAAENLGQEKRQRFMDLMHAGKNIGEASDIMAIDSGVGAAIVVMNIAEIQYLRKDSV